jgi:O-antigen biosynthesis protein
VGAPAPRDAATSVMAPRFSIVTPVHDPPLRLLRECLGSVHAQTYPSWELCLVDDGSTRREVRRELRRAAGADPRVKLVERPASGGIVAASNDALAMATGDFVVPLDHDDRLEPRALELVENALSGDPEIDYVYTDEDKLAPDGTVSDTFYKPDWSPERLRAQNYCTHLSVTRRSLVAAVGGFRAGFDGSQDHDLILRVTERARRVHHVPEVLYHWCITPGSAAADSADAPAAKPYAQEAGRRAVGEQMVRLGIDATVEHLARRGQYRVRRARPQPAPTVSVIVSTAGTTRPVWGVERPLVLEAVRSVRDVTAYPTLEIVVVTDPDLSPAVAEGLAALDVRLVAGAGAENEPSRCNRGVEASSGEYVVLLADDTLVEQPDWLDAMLGFFREPDVGAVGARLLSADGTLRHGGILLNGGPLPIFEGFAGDDPGAFGLLEIDREVSAVAGACLATPRAVYDELGGMGDEFTAYGDVDYSLRVRTSGRRIIWTPHATLYRFASADDSSRDEQRELALLRERWGEQLVRDPYGNPNLAPGQAVWLPAERASTLAALRAAWRGFRFAGRT